MPDDDPHTLAPEVGGPAAPPSTAWQERAGLTLRQAEELLDWLEVQGVSRREALVTAEGCVVRWQA